MWLQLICSLFLPSSGCSTVSVRGALLPALHKTFVCSPIKLDYLRGSSITHVPPQHLLIWCNMDQARHCWVFLQTIGGSENPEIRDCKSSVMPAFLQPCATHFQHILSISFKPVGSYITHLSA